jgi:putative peptidoglycan lipid II flippase
VAARVGTAGVRSSRMASETKPTPAGTGKYALLVAAGIFLSRIFGLVRGRAMAHYLGNSAANDAFTAALRIPNYLQNLFGEGALSASFIPVYAKLLAQGDEKEAGRVAGAVFALLALLVSVLVLLGIFAAPWLVGIIAFGFEGEKRELTIKIVRILFPGTGLLVLSAWCLGVLNSHRRFFLSYVSPVLWNLAIIAALIGFGGAHASAERLSEMALLAAWGSVAGSALQFGIQLPTALRLARHLRVRLDTRAEGVRTALRNFVPAFVGRGVVQISAFCDEAIASLLPDGAISAMGYAQTLYLLPVSLFGMSVSAVELTAMSGAMGSAEEVNQILRQRLSDGMRRIAFFIVPSLMGFLLLGDVIAGAIFQSGRFKGNDSLYVWSILAGSSVGLLAATWGRLTSSTFYALQDTRTPLRCAVVRVALGIALGFLLATRVPQLLGLEAKWGAALLTTASGLAAWVEFLLLRRALQRRIGPATIDARHLARLLAAALIGAALAWGVKILAGRPHPVILAACVLAPYGAAYFALAAALGVGEARALFGRLSRLAGR